ncbi:hypothetical protein HQ42_07300 [Porphyromonas gulae]|nr:hypothetical protein HQ42_07300 [Porphyromonas gulae]
MVELFIKQIDNKIYKKKGLGGILFDKKVRSSERIFDFMLDGGTTGFIQSLIKPSGTKDVIDKDAVVGPKFFVRLWMPHADYGFLFIQSYSTLSIKPIIEELLDETLRHLDCQLLKKPIVRTTTQERINQFLGTATVVSITIFAPSSPHSTKVGEIKDAAIRITGASIAKTVLSQGVSALNKLFGISYHPSKETRYQITYESEGKERSFRTDDLIDDRGNVKIIPPIYLPQNCIDENSHPRFEELGQFVDVEMAKLKGDSPSIFLD